MSFLEKIDFLQREERVTRYLLPQRIVLQRGGVSGAARLLKKKELQIDLNEPVVTTLKNAPGARRNAAVLLDFGFEFHGGLRLLSAFIQGPGVCAGNTLPGALVRLSFGESVSEALSVLGERGACNDHSPRVLTVEIAALSDLVFGQTGYRFVLVELLTPGTSWALKSAVGAFTYRDLPYLGGFECSDPLLNRIFDTAAYTCHLNMQNLLWDGIKRDRLVWVGDTHPEMLTIRTLFGHVDMLDESLRFARKKAPLPRFMNGMPSYSLWWLLILHDYYMATGDRRFLAENKKYAMGLARQMAGYVSDDGTHSLPAYFLDWPTADTPAAMPGVHGLLVLSLRASAELAGWYGDAECAALCTARAAALAHHHPDCRGAKQALAMQTLAGLREPAAMAKRLTADGAKGMSTFMSYYILRAMSTDNMAAALGVLREYYGGMLRMGATTFWEDFHVEWLDNAAPIDEPVPAGKRDLHGDFGDFCYKGFRHSLCHGWSSGPVPFLAERVLGVRIAEPGCRKMRLEPDLGDLDWARGTYPTPFGVLSVSVTRENGALAVEYTAPRGVTVELAPGLVLRNKAQQA